MKILISPKQLNNLKKRYKSKYIDNALLFRAPSLENGVNQNLNKLKILDLIELFGELCAKSNGLLKRENPIGVGEDKTPIQLYTLDGTKNGDKPIILIVGGVHGDEKTSIYGIYKTIKFLLEKNRWSRFIKQNFIVQIIPCLNAYGFNNNKRNNANDKDLNRDFEKKTQSETKALTKYINQHKDKIVMVLDSHNAYNEEFISCKQEMKFFDEYEDVALKLNLFLNGNFNCDDKKSYLWISRSKNDGTLSDFINKNKLIGHTLESPRSLRKEIHYPNPINYEDGCEVTMNLLVNLMCIYGKMYNEKILRENRGRKGQKLLMEDILYHCSNDLEKSTRNGIWLSKEPDNNYGQGAFAFDVDLSTLKIADELTAIKYLVKYGMMGWHELINDPHFDYSYNDDLLDLEEAVEEGEVSEENAFKYVYTHPQMIKNDITDCLYEPYYYTPNFLNYLQEDGYEGYSFHTEDANDTYYFIFDSSKVRQNQIANPTD